MPPVKSTAPGAGPIASDPTVRGAARAAALVAIPLAALTGVVVFWLLGGFAAGSGRPGAAATPTVPQATATGPVTVAAPALDERAATVCQTLVAHLPDRLRDRVRRAVTAGAGTASGTGSEQNAAYGDPPVTVACGAPTPSYAPDAEADTVSGVCWLARADAGNGWVFTTLDRQVAIVVTLPKRYDPPGQWVVDFSPAIVASVPSLATAPSGCSGKAN